jgi:hypothetical protein
MPRMPLSFERYTLVTLSAQPDAQDDIGVATHSCCVDHRTNVGWLLPDLVPPLSEAQTKTVRECLLRQDPLAWEHMVPEVRSLLSVQDGTEGRNGLNGESAATQALVTA